MKYTFQVQTEVNGVWHKLGGVGRIYDDVRVASHTAALTFEAFPQIIAIQIERISDDKSD